MIIAGLAFALSADQLAAQNVPPGRGRGRGPALQQRAEVVRPAGLPPFYRLYDANQDGALQPEEVAQIPALLGALDKNKDKNITADEFCPNPAAGPGQGRGAMSGPGCLALFDKDQDGALSNDEIAAIPAALAVLDKNNDTKLTADELCVGRGVGGGRGPGMGKGMGRRGAGPGNGFGGAGNPNCPLRATGQ